MDTIIEAIFKDDNDEPLLIYCPQSATTLGEIRKANPSALGDVWVEFHLPTTGRLEKIEYFTASDQDRAALSYHMNIDDINALINGDATMTVASVVRKVIADWSEPIRRALGANSLAINWGGPNEKYVMAEGSVLYYMDGEMAFFEFEREHKSRAAIDNVTLDELISRASVLCDHMEKMSAEIRDSISSSQLQ